MPLISTTKRYNIIAWIIQVRVKVLFVKDVSKFPTAKVFSAKLLQNYEPQNTFFP